MITFNADTTDVAPTEPTVARDINPADIEDKPTPISVNPAPIPIIDNPINVKAPDNPRIDGINGVSKAPAVPIIAKAPAKVINPLATLIQLKLASVFIIAVNIDNAPAAISKEVEPVNVPVINFSPMASSANAPPIMVNPFPISIQLIFPNCNTEFDNAFNAILTDINPRPIEIMFFGMRFEAIDTSANAPPIADNPLANPSQLITPNDFILMENIFIASPKSNIATPVEIIFLVFPV